MLAHTLTVESCGSMKVHLGMMDGQLIEVLAENANINIDQHME